MLEEAAPSTATPVVPNSDLSVLEKYDQPGPRYTSYPTAPNFYDLSCEEYRQLLAEQQNSVLPLSLYLHVPFCQTRCYFCGCQVTISRSSDRANRYLDSMMQEFRLVLAAGVGSRQVAQIHWGGGTPNFLQPEELYRLGTLLRSELDWRPDYEFGVEIDPRRVSVEALDALAEVGVNRLSLGVQDVDPRVQTAINRVQSNESIHSLIEAARNRGINSINLDLIYGLPFQTVETFSRTLEEVRRFDADRLALFNFAYLPQQLAHQRVIDPDSLPSPTEKLTIARLAADTLEEWGYQLIGMDHFAKPDDSLAKAQRNGTITRNFQGYSTHGASDLVGLGNSAIGQIAATYVQNIHSVAEYEARIAEGRLAVVRGLTLSAEDRLRRDVIHQLFCHLAVDKRAVEARHREASGDNLVFESHFARALERLKPMIADELLVETDSHLKVTDLGRWTLRNVAMAFDNYLGKDRTGVTFSRTV